MGIDTEHEYQLVVQLLADGCTQYRKGEAVTERMVGNVQVVEAYAMPPVPDDPPEAEQLVDVHFMVIGVNRPWMEAGRERLVAYCRDVPRMGDGLSYIALGGHMGDQTLALMLLAAGEVLGFWHVVTPEKLGLTGEAADRAAGNGYVMASGFHPEVRTA